MNNGVLEHQNDDRRTYFIEIYVFDCQIDTHVGNRNRCLWWSEMQLRLKLFVPDCHLWSAPSESQHFAH